MCSLPTWLFLRTKFNTLARCYTLVSTACRLQGPPGKWKLIDVGRERKHDWKMIISLDKGDGGMKGAVVAMLWDRQEKVVTMSVQLEKTIRQEEPVKTRNSSWKHNGKRNFHHSMAEQHIGNCRRKTDYEAGSRDNLENRRKACEGLRLEGIM